MSEKRSPLGVLFLTLFIDLVGFSIIFPLFPAMLEYYLEVEAPGGLLATIKETLESLAGGDPENQAHYTAVLFGGFLGSIYSALQFLFAPFWGRLSDQYGRRPILLISISGLALSYLLWIVSGSFELLVAARLLGGCMSGNISTANAAVADSTSRANRAKGMGVIGAAFGLGFIFGPAIGGLAAQINFLESFPGLEAYGVNPFSAPALAAFLLAVVNVLWVTLRFDETTTSKQRAEAKSLRRPLHPLMLLGKVDVAGVTRANWTYFLFLLAFAGVEFTLTFFVFDSFNYKTTDIAVLFVVAGLVIALVQGGIVRRVAPRYGEKNVALAGLVTLVPGFFLIGFSPPSQVQLYLGLVFLSVGSALAIPCLTSLVSLYTPPDRQGAILGVFRSLGALSRAVGPILFCAIYWKLGKVWPYVSGAVLLALPIVLAATLPQPSKEKDESAPSQ